MALLRLKRGQAWQLRNTEHGNKEHGKRDGTFQPRLGHAHCGLLHSLIQSLAPSSCPMDVSSKQPGSRYPQLSLPASTLSAALGDS